MGSPNSVCDNIRNGHLYGGDFLFVILKGIYSFKFPKRFWRSLPEISLLLFSFVNPNHLKTWLPNHWCPFPFHSQGWMPCNQQSHILTVYQTHVFAKLHKQNENWLRLKILLSSNEKERIGCNGVFCTALGADCNLSFEKLCKCICKSEPGCWKSNSTESFDLIQRNKQTKQFSKDSIESHSGDATVSRLKQYKQRLILQTHSFFHTSVGCCSRCK